MEMHPGLVKIISAGWLDPARARKATRATRDAVFYKLNAYIRNLHCRGKVTWKSYKDAPCQSIYNMEEASTDTTKHRSKIIANEAAIIWKYTEMPEGDDEMNMHITACLTMRTNGKSLNQTRPKVDCCVRWLLLCVLILPPPPGTFHDIENGIKGAPAPMSIHTDKSKTKSKEAEERESESAMVRLQENLLSQDASLTPLSTHRK
jgi:hypothetical protein